MSDKKVARIRRARRSRAHIKNLGVNRLTIHRTSQHIYAQVISVCGTRVLAAASSLEPEVRKSLPNGGDISAAKTIGQLIAERAKQVGIDQVAFDRSGFRYHGRIKALADAAREAGLKF